MLDPKDGMAASMHDVSYHSPTAVNMNCVSTSAPVLLNVLIRVPAVLREAITAICNTVRSTAVAVTVGRLANGVVNVIV